MNYPPGHPSGVIRHDGTVQCPGCDETLNVESEYEQATGATAVTVDGDETDECPNCGADLQDALGRVEWE